MTTVPAQKALISSVSQRAIDVLFFLGHIQRDSDGVPERRIESRHGEDGAPSRYGWQERIEPTLTRA